MAEDLILKPATLADAPEIAQIKLTRMKTAPTSPRILLKFANCDPDDVLAWNLANVRAELEGVRRLGLQAAEALKVVGVVGGREVVVGVGVWGWGKAAGEQYGDGEGDGRGEKHPIPLSGIPLPKGVNMELRKGFRERLDEMEERYRPKGRGFELLELLNRPEYQRTGVGSRLVRYGLDRADKEGVPCFLSASPMGAPLYKELGFEEAARVEVGLEQYVGVKGTKHVHLIMIRQPVKVEA